jgi:hypothetical protein
VISIIGRSLPAILQEFAGIFPVSSAGSSIIFVLVGEECAGYNPLNSAQTGLTLLISLDRSRAECIFKVLLEERLTEQTNHKIAHVRQQG